MQETLIFAIRNVIIVVLIRKDVSMYSVRKLPLSLSFSFDKFKVNFFNYIKIFNKYTIIF